jgi:hypothetical protein
MTRASGFRNYVEQRFTIYGKLGDTVYRRKRNGTAYNYPYQFKPKYSATVLSRRSNAIARIAASVSNPRHADYKSIINRIYYYTPYFVYAGSYKFTCNTFYKLREKGEYEIKMGGMGIVRKLAPRTKVEYSFTNVGSHRLECWHNGTLYSEREVIVITAESELEAVYGQWFAEHLAEILALPEPGFTSLKRYHRCLKGTNYLASISGKAEENLYIYQGNKPDVMYSRQSADHSGNPQTHYFCLIYPHIRDCWKVVNPSFLSFWQVYQNKWLNAHIKKSHKATGILHLWTSAVIRAAAETGFDLEHLSPENWLPGIETLVDLVTAAGYKRYDVSDKVWEQDIM